VARKAGQLISRRSRNMADLRFSWPRSGNPELKGAAANRLRILDGTISQNTFRSDFIQRSTSLGFSSESAIAPISRRALTNLFGREVAGLMQRTFPNGYAFVLIQEGIYCFFELVALLSW